MSSTPRKHAFIRFGTGPLLRTELRKTFHLALPLMLGELSSMLMGVVGIMMIGSLGETALAASSIAGVVFVLSMLLVWGGVRMIPTPVAEAHELRDGTRVRTLLLAGGLLSIFFLVVCSGLLWLGIHYFYLLKQDPEVSVLAVDYLKIIVYSLPALILFAILVNFMDAFEYVKTTMFISFFGLALDVSLNWLLIFGHWGFPKLGFNAIALNTGISHAAMTLLLLVILWKKKELQYIRSAHTQLKDIWEQTFSFIKVGIPSAFQIMIEFAAFGVGTIIIGQINKTEQAAHQIALNLISVTYVTIMGVSTAGMIRVGQAMAYNSRVRIWMAGVASMTLAMLIMLAPTLAFLCFPTAIAQLYIEDPAVIQLATGLLFFAGLFQLADAAQASSISLLRSLNDVIQPSVISLISFWLIGVPLGYWLAIPQGWHAKGIWMGYLVALIIQAVLFVKRFFKLVRERQLMQ